jgi:hypothetical protein
MRSRKSAWWFVAALGLMVVLGTAAPASAADATGTWKWTTERNGNTVESTLKLKQDGDKLTGSVKRNDNETEIEDGKVTGDMITFKVTREFNGNKFVMTYKGKVSADSIKGDISFEREGNTETREWEAKRDK